MTTTELRGLLKSIKRLPYTKKAEVYSLVLETALVRPDSSFYEPEFIEIQHWLQKQG